MTMSDPIADMLTRIRNANTAFKPYTDVPSSKLKLEMLRILKEEAFIEGYNYLDDKKQGIIRIYLRYGKNRERAITGIERVSRPGLRKYVNGKQIPDVRGGLGVALISTSRGVLSDGGAREQKIGGEVLCYIW